MGAASADRPKAHSGGPARISGGLSGLPRGAGAGRRAERHRGRLFGGERFLVMLGVRPGCLVGVALGA
jgi:hypothetical protein